MSATRAEIGYVSLVDLSGEGTMSARLEVWLTPQPPVPGKTTHVAYGLRKANSDPEFFAAATSVLTAAFLAKQKVFLSIPTFQPPKHTPGEPDLFCGVRIGVDI